MSNLTKRILSAAVLIPFVIFLVFFSSEITLELSLAFIAAVSGYEFSSISLFPNHKSFSYFIALLTGFLTFLIPFSLTHPIYLILFLGFFVLIVPMLFMFSATPLKDSLHSVAFSFFGVIYCGVLASFLSLISLFNPDNGRYFIFMLLLGTFMGDTGAYTFGRLLGKRKLAPRLSPGKTWAGAFGGLLMTFSSIVVVKFSMIPSLTFLEIIPLSFALSFFCQVGDLSESFLKRGFGVKDSGRIIPGHGGLLDRIDALLFGAPIVFLFSYLR